MYIFTHFDYKKPLMIFEERYRAKRAVLEDLELLAKY